jgi:hypothetical protein
MNLAQSDYFSRRSSVQGWRQNPLIALRPGGRRTLLSAANLDVALIGVQPGDWQARD